MLNWLRRFVDELRNPMYILEEYDDYYDEEDEYEVIQENFFGDNKVDDEFLNKYTFVEGNHRLRDDEVLEFEIEYLDPDQVLDAMEIEISVTPYTEVSDVDQNQSNYEDSFTA